MANELLYDQDLLGYLEDTDFNKLKANSAFSFVEDEDAQRLIIKAMQEEELDTLEDIYDFLIDNDLASNLATYDTLTPELINSVFSNYKTPFDVLDHFDGDINTSDDYLLFEPSGHVSSFSYLQGYYDTNAPEIIRIFVEYAINNYQD